LRLCVGRAKFPHGNHTIYRQKALNRAGPLAHGTPPLTTTGFFIAIFLALG
jgi:hypothetical protein